MPFIPVPLTAQLELTYTFQGQVCQNVIHYEKDTDWDTATLFDIADSVAATYAAGPVSILSTDCVLYLIRAIDLSSAIGPVVEYDGILPIAGTNVSPALPNNVSCAMTKRTALRGRSYRGRVFQLGLCENSVAGNNVAGAHLTLLIDLWTDMLTYTIDGETANMVVVSRYADNEPRVFGVTTPVTHFTSDSVIDSQRRRLPGRGQ